MRLPGRRLHEGGLGNLDRRKANSRMIQSWPMPRTDWTNLAPSWRGW
jgi:hypothetical protein